MKYIIVIAVIICVSTFKQSNAVDLSNNFENITIEITSPKKEYILGDYINFFVVLKNSGNIPIEWPGIIGNEIGTQYRLFLFKENKSKIMYPQQPIIKMRGENKSSIRASVSSHRVNPQEKRMRKILLNKWFDIKDEGTYCLIVMLRHPVSWDKGFVSSNIFKFKVVSPSKSELLNKK